MTTKILDATVINANLKEITSIDFIDRCSKIYSIETSTEVYNEILKGFGRTITDKQFQWIDVIDIQQQSQYSTIVQYMEDRYPYLHVGEISSFLLALLNHKLKRKKYYYITDDQRIRKVISKLEGDILFFQNFNFNVSGFFVTGTIALLKKLFDRDVLSKKEIDNIIKDLRNSTFYLTSDLIEYLKGC